MLIAKKTLLFVFLSLFILQCMEASDDSSLGSSLSDSTASVVGGNNTDIIDTYDEVDITMLAFSSSKLSIYLNALAVVGEVPLSRVTMQFIDNADALELGWEYLFPIKILGPTNVGTDVETAAVVAARLETALNHPEKKTLYSAIHKATMIAGRRVKVEFRERVEITSGVDYVWIAFLIMGLIMLVAAAAVVLRPRGADADTLLEDEDEEEEMHELPDIDLLRRAEVKQEEAALAAGEKQIDRHYEFLKNRGGDTKKILKMMDATLEYDRQWSLPLEWHEIEEMKRRKKEDEAVEERRMNQQVEGGSAGRQSPSPTLMVVGSLEHDSVSGDGGAGVVGVINERSGGSPNPSNPNPAAVDSAANQSVPLLKVVPEAVGNAETSRTTATAVLPPSLNISKNSQPLVIKATAPGGPTSTAAASLAPPRPRGKNSLPHNADSDDDL